MQLFSKKTKERRLSRKEYIAIIDQLKKDLELLKENAKYSQELLKSGSWTYFFKTDELIMTDEVYSILECAPQVSDSRPESFFPYIHPEDLEQVKQIIQAKPLLEEYDMEFRVITPGGLNKHVQQKAKVLYDENKSPDKLIGIVQDITNYKVVENSLRAISENLTLAQEVAGVGSWKYDIIADEFMGTEELYKIFGVEPSALNKKFSDSIKFIHPEDQQKIKAAIEENMAGKSYRLEYRIPQPDGSIKYVSGKGEPIFDKDNRVVAVIGTLQDITQEKELQNSLDAKNKEINEILRRYEVLIRESSDVFEILEPDGTIKYMSGAARKVIGYSPEERLGKSIFEYYGEEEGQKLREMLKNVLKNPEQPAREDIVFITKFGKEIILAVNMQNLLNEPAIKGIAVNFRDITQRVSMNKHIIHLSTHYELTGLYNSLFFKRELERRCHSSIGADSKFAVMMLDMDEFKLINDALGYSTGDKLLIRIGDRLKSNLGDTNIICRYSGNLFAIIVDNIKTKEGFVETAQRIVELFRKPFHIDQYELNVTTSIGIRIYRGEKSDAELLIKHAEAALFLAKNSGRNKYIFYSSDINIQSFKQFQMRNSLKNALENNEFRVFFQPIVKLKTNEILAAEALIRWEHPDWGLISPSEFIALAEEAGHIINIAYWVLREVCRCYKNWLENDMPKIKVSINISGVHIFERNFVENIKKSLDEFGLDPGFLIIEITESTLIKGADKIENDLKKLQALGIQIALDDFGTGYSSLAYLSNLNIDILKLDSCFVKNGVSSESGGIIIRSIIDMVQELKMKIVAEGIEDWQQLTLLRELNCYAGQGYIYDKPMPVNEFEKVLAKGKCKPVIINDSPVAIRKERRKYFRVKFPFLLEADMTILEFRGQKMDMGNTKVLVKNMGPGGLCLISNINIPVEKDVILQFTTTLAENEIKVYGFPVWTRETENGLHEYGVCFTIDENERTELTGILNNVQIKIRNNILFAEGSFVSASPVAYYFNE